MHFQNIDELYQASWRPTLIDHVPSFGQTIPPAPAPSESALNYEGTKKATPAKAAGAYRPPGARGLATPAIFKREDEGGLPANGSSTSPRMFNRNAARGVVNGAGSPNGIQNGGRRHVPGAPSPGPEGAERKGGKRKKGKKDGEEGGNGGKEGRGKRDGALESVRSPRSSPPPAGQSNGNTKGNKKKETTVETTVHGDTAIAENETSTPAPPADGTLDPIAKKVRNLNKKLKAIEELKEKAKRGERLEATQLKKMDGEADIRKELASLGGVPVVS